MERGQQMSIVMARAASPGSGASISTSTSTTLNNAIADIGSDALAIDVNEPAQDVLNCDMDLYYENEDAAKPSSPQASPSSQPTSPSIQFELSSSRKSRPSGGLFSKFFRFSSSRQNSTTSSSGGKDNSQPSSPYVLFLFE